MHGSQEKSNLSRPIQSSANSTEKKEKKVFSLSNCGWMVLMVLEKSKNMTFTLWQGESM